MPQWRKRKNLIYIIPIIGFLGVAVAAPPKREKQAKAPTTRGAKRVGPRSIAPAGQKASSRPTPQRARVRPIAKPPPLTPPKSAAQSTATTGKPTARDVVAQAKPVKRSTAVKTNPMERRMAPKRLPPLRRRRPQPKAATVVWSQTYDMLFRGKRVGEYIRRERRRADGSVIVDNKSHLTIKMLLAKVTAVNSSHCEYDRTGQLTKFTITSTVRGKTTHIKGFQTPKGLTITQQIGKKSQRRFFAAAQYQGTSLDLRFPTASPGVRFTRRYLIIPRMKIISQTLQFRAVPSEQVFGKKQPLLELQLKNARGSGILLLTRDGRMVSSKMQGLLGRVEIRIKQRK